MTSDQMPGYGPPHLPPTGETRFGAGTRILVVLIAMALGAGIWTLLAAGGTTGRFPTGSFRGSPHRAGWTIYESGRLGWGVEFPSSWYAQRIEDVRRSPLYSTQAHGVVIANVSHPLKRGSCGPGCRSTMVDNIRLPSDAVLVQITRSYGGHFACLQSHQTALPLSLARASRQTTRQGAGGSPQLALSMAFLGPPISTSIGNEAASYTVNAWVGSMAPSADLKILEQIVASISYKISLPTLAPGTSPNDC